MKKITFLFALMLASATMWAASSSFHFSAETNGQTLYYRITALDTKTLTIVAPNNAVQFGTNWDGYDSPTGTLTIPDTVPYNNEKYVVRRIDKNAFKGCAGLTSVLMNEAINLTYIGNSAFENCIGLNSVILSSAITVIKKSVFAGCTNLADITFSANVEQIGGEQAFSDTKWFKDQPDGALYIGKCLYAYKGAMPANTGITVKEGTTQICNNAFRNQTNLANITLSDSLTRISSNAFDGCTGLNVPLAIGENVEEIGQDAFINASFTAINVDANNPNFSSVDGVLYNNDTTKLYLCPKGMTGEAIIPNSVELINEGAFMGCSKLTAVTFPSGITEVESSFFEGCFSLADINFPGGLEKIGGGAAFSDTKWFKDQADGLIYIGKCLYTYKGTMPANSSIIIKEGITQICGSAFKGQTNLVSITLPDSLTRISSYAFEGCSGLNSPIAIGKNVNEIGYYVFKGSKIAAINVDENNTKFSSAEGILYDNDTISLIVCPGGKTGEVTIPASVLQVIPNAFYGCDVTINTNENNRVFCSIEGILYRKDTTRLVLCPKGVTGDITIPNSVTFMESCAFADCSELTSVVLPSEVTEIQDGLFARCTKLAEITFPTNVEQIGGDNALSDTKWFKDQANSVVYVGRCLYGYSGTMPANTSIVVNEGITQICGDAFKEQTNLVEITLPDSIKRISSRAFKGCTGLKSIIIRATEYPHTGEDLFADVNLGNVELYVPAAALIDYQKELSTAGFKSISTIELAEAKVARKAEVDALDDSLTETDYTEASWAAFQAAMIADKAAIDACTSVDAVNNYVLTAKVDDLVEDPSSVEDAQAEIPFAQIGNNLQFTQATQIAVHSISGKMVYSGIVTSYELPSTQGMYFIKTTKGNFKAIAK